MLHKSQWQEFIPAPFVCNVTAAGIFKLCCWKSTSKLPRCVACTSEGSIMEFQEKKLLRCADIDLKDVCEIEIMPKYFPNGWVYILTSPSQGIVLVDGGSLKTSGCHPEASKALVGDFKRVGWPQLKLFSGVGDSEEILDLQCTEKKSDLRNIDADMHLHRALLSSQLLMRDMEIKVEEEARLLARQMAQLGIPVTGLTDEPPLIDIPSGKLKAPFIEFPAAPLMPSLLVLKSWHRLLHESWILCAKIKNVGSVPVNDIEGLVIGMDSPKLIFKTSCWKLERGLDTLEQCDTVMSGDTIILAVQVDLPDFSKSSEINLHWQTCYVVEKKNQALSVGLFTLDSIAVAAGDLSVNLENGHAQSEDTIKEDLLSIAVCSYVAVLEFCSSQGKPTINVENVMENHRLQLVRVGRTASYVWYQPQRSGTLGNIIIHLKEDSLQLKIFARNESQLVMFVRLLSSLLPSGIQIVPVDNSSHGHLLKSVSNEVAFLKQRLEQQIRQGTPAGKRPWDEDSTTSYPDTTAVDAEDYLKLLEELQQLSRNTDQEFTKLLE